MFTIVRQMGSLVCDALALAARQRYQAAMTSPTALPPKKDVALALLENSTVFVHLDPRIDDVRVPQWFKKQPQLVLQIGLNMPVPIPDLNVDEVSVSCTLSFSRSPFFCFIPWESVYALVGEDGRGMVWPEDVPPEVAAQAAAQQKAKPEQRPHLRAVRDEDAPPDAAPEPEAVPDGPAEVVEAAPQPKRPAARKRTRKKASPRPKLAPVDAPADAPVEEQAAERAGGDGKSKRKLPPYLRVVK